MSNCSKCELKYDSEIQDEEVFGICQKCGKARINDKHMIKVRYKGMSLLFSRALSIFRAA